MTYTMTKLCPICKPQLTMQKPTETVPCMCGQHVWQGERLYECAGAQCLMAECQY